jgi:hypothetical protein
MAGAIRGLMGGEGRLAVADAVLMQRGAPKQHPNQQRSERLCANGLSAV